VIARLNIGGPAIQAITLTQRLEHHGYATTLVRGTEERDEGSMDELAATLGVRPVLVSPLRRNPGRHDLRALWSLVRIIRTQRPHIVHTHAAKAGTLGRLAALIAFPRSSRRPVIVHTYHGHSLTGYFSTPATVLYRGIEWLLARISDLLIAVSPEVQEDLVALGVAPATKFEVLRLGFDLSPFAAPEATRARARRELREELGIPPDARVVTLVARLVPIKRVDRFLRVAQALSDIPDVRFLIVGDGELQRSLRASPEASALGERVSWAGFRRDMPAVYFASDVVIQTSDNEGTPVALIEAQAAGVPVVSTRVGGAASALVGRSCLAEVDDERELAHAVRSLLSAPPRLDARARAEAQSRFDIDVLVPSLDSLYRRLLGTSAVGV
jgi:glycosyltransferase involved in cell wall biosynthesis